LFHLLLIDENDKILLSQFTFSIKIKKTNPLNNKIKMTNKVPKLDTAAYLKASDSYCFVVFPTGSTQIRSRPMKHFSKPLLENGWCRIHKSYLVNPDFVQNISEDRDSIYLQNGTILPISRRNRTQVIKWRNNKI
jgi:two-component system LytT family response regulator